MDIEKAKRHFLDIYEAQSDSVWRFCLWKVSDSDAALDIVQECFMRYWDTLAKGEQITNDRAFLFTVARRLVIDRYRRKKAESLDALAERSDDDPFEVSDGQTVEILGASAEARFAIEKISALDPSYRQAVYLRYIEGLDPADIALVLGIEPNAASVRIHRGMERLKEILGADNPKKYER